MTRWRRKLLAPYHFAWAVLSALWYGFPAKKMIIIGVTGTKGKSSVAEMLYEIFKETGYKTALSSTIHFAIGDELKPNLFKMTLPGHGFIQKFLSDALSKKCTHAIIEITSEAAIQYRHFGLFLNALVFTNLQKEHLESHGSMENYFRAKFSIGKSLAMSSKRPRVIVANRDDLYGAAFLSLPVEKNISFSYSDAEKIQEDEQKISFTYGKVSFHIQQPGRFSVMNAIASIKIAEALGIELETCRKALEKISCIRGRVENVYAGQNFLVIVDYAHTPDSLRSLYETFEKRRKICVLGNTGGGRDKWKRPEMGKIADEMCEKVFLTNEDPYDEDPNKIIAEMASDMKKTPEIILNRREAIRAALRFALSMSKGAARHDNAVLITGKGTDPFIMGPRGSKIPWSDVDVVKEELNQLMSEV